MKLTRWLATGLTVVLGAALYACGGGSTGSVVVQAATPLAIVKPAASCAGLASVDLSDVGGAGSTIAR